MNDDEKLSHLIGMLYEAVMAPELWPEVLELCTGYVGAVGAHLLTLNKDRGDIELSLFGGELMSAQNTAAYASYYIHIDPRQTSGMMNGAAVHEWRSCHHYLDERFVAGNEFYQDYLIPEGGRYSMGAWVDDNADNYALLGLHRGPRQAPFGEREQAAARRFSPHLQRALRLHAHTRQMRGRAEMGVRAIDAMACATLIVDGDARILHSNASAERWLAGRFGGLSCCFGRLTCDDATVANRLSTLIDQATGYPASAAAIDLVMAPGGRMTISPLPASSEWATEWQKPLALVSIVDSQSGLHQPRALDADFRIPDGQAADKALRQIVDDYRLTRREVAVLQELVEGLSTREIADQRQVSRNTVRSQLASLMQKTHCRSQKELVKLFFNSVNRS